MEIIEIKYDRYNKYFAVPYSNDILNICRSCGLESYTFQQPGFITIYLSNNSLKVLRNFISYLIWHRKYIVYIILHNMYINSPEPDPIYFSLTPFGWVDIFNHPSDAVFDFNVLNHKPRHGPDTVENGRVVCIAQNNIYLSSMKRVIEAGFKVCISKEKYLKMLLT